MRPRERPCGGTNADGQQCASPIVGEDGFCPAHRPGGRERMKRLARKGGIKSREPSGLDPSELPELQTHADAQAWLETIGRSVASGRLGDRQAQAAIRAVSEWVRAEGERQTSEVVNELKAEIEAVKAEVGSRSIKAL